MARDTKKTESRVEAFAIAGQSLAPGSRNQLELPVSRLPDGSWLTLPIAVLHGAKAGKTLWLTAAVHGDELNGIEIIRELLTRVDPRTLAGTVVAVPIVNVFGVLQGSRYLPDRRDLNRAFPGSPRGSLASRLAHILMREVIGHGHMGVDYHTGSGGRANLPQIRIEADDREASRLANIFAAPVIFHAPSRRGSLRWAAAEARIPSLLFEGGAASMLDDASIQFGVDGTLRLMKHARMITEAPPAALKSVHCLDSAWVRAKAGGICRIQVRLGEKVRANDTVAIVRDAFNTKPNRVRAKAAGVVIGLTQNPLVNSGDALVHVATPRH